jgi:hypothetical protein
MTNFSVINIPEICYFNSFIEELSNSFSSAGINVIFPNICQDSPHYMSDSYPVDLIKKNLEEVFENEIKKIFIFHWPEKLYRKL